MENRVEPKAKNEETQEIMTARWCIAVNLPQDVGMCGIQGVS